MDFEKIDSIAKSLMEDRKAHLEREKGGIYYHGQRTANLALSLRQEIIPGDTSHDDILKAAAWFHDCAKGIEPHAEYGALVARHALKGEIAPDGLDKVCDLISLHCLRKPDDNSFDDYTRLLQDADLIDHFGTYEIWMNIQYWAHTGGTMEDMIKWYDDNHTAHIARHRALLNYRLSQEIFDERTAFEGEYVARLKDEGAGRIHKSE